MLFRIITNLFKGTNEKDKKKLILKGKSEHNTKVHFSKEVYIFALCMNIR